MLQEEVVQPPLGASLPPRPRPRQLPFDQTRTAFDQNPCSRRLLRRHWELLSPLGPGLASCRLIKPGPRLMKTYAPGGCSVGSPLKSSRSGAPKKAGRRPKRGTAQRPLRAGLRPPAGRRRCSVRERASGRPSMSCSCWTRVRLLPSGTPRLRSVFWRRGMQTIRRRWGTWELGLCC